MKVNEKTFEPKSLVENEFFIESFKEVYLRLKEKRNSRDIPKHGMSYKRDWLDNLEYNGLYDFDSVSKELELIINKDSKLSLKTRNVIKAIYSISLQEFTEKVVKTGHNELQNENRNSA